LISETRRPEPFLLLRVGEHGPRRRPQVDALGALGGVPARVLAEDQRVEERVGAEPVAAVDRHAGDFAGGVEAGDRGAAHPVRLHPAHRVVVAGLYVDRLAGDVDPGEVAPDQHDLA
jgi:hypothetical protein